MNKLEKIIELILGTSIIWMPIVGCVIAQKLSEIITMDMIMNAVYFLLIATIVTFIGIDFKETKEEKRRIRLHGKIK